MTPAIPQLPLALGNARNTGFDALIGVDAGLRSRLESIACLAVRTHVCVTGATGSGKTHVLMAMAAHARCEGISAAYVSALGLRGALTHVLPMQRANQLVCIDHLDAALGSAEDEEALFHFHNAMTDAGANIVYAMAKPVQETTFSLADLRSRLAQCEQVVMRALDDEGRARMLHNAAIARGMDMDDAAVQWMLRRFDRDATALMAAMEVIDHATLAAHRRVTIPFLRDVFSEQSGV